MQDISEKYAMIAATANNILGDYSATRVDAEQFEERLLELHPDFMHKIADSKRRHVRGMVAEYVGVGKKRPQRPVDAPEIRIKSGERGHEEYEIRKAAARVNGPAEQVQKLSHRERLLVELAGIEQTDIPVESKMRAEQPLIRKYLLDGRANADCALCGKTFESEYLDACHIIPRRLLTDEERRIPPDAQATLMCPLCHKAFDLGHITVNANDLIQLTEPGAKHRHLDHLVGQNATIGDRQRESYRKRFRSEG